MNNNVLTKTISFMLICAMLFCLSACGGSGNSEKEQREKELITLTWTENPFAEKVPTPKSTLGYINNNNRSMFEVYLSDFTLNEFNEYVNACIEMGYTVEQNRQDAFFYAQTEDYYEVRVEHEDGNIIHIAISEVEYDVEIKVIRTNNSSKCDVEIEIDGYYEEEIESGDMVASFDSYLNAGTHELRVINAEDSDIYGTIFFDVTSDSYYEFEFNCTDVEVEISERGVANGQQVETETERPSDNKTESNTNKEPESSSPSITKGEDMTIPDNTTSSNGKKCEECGKTATKTVNLFGQTEYYCANHYNEIMDILDMMESDVGKGSASKHTCEECSNEGTHSIIGFSGETEYYCTKHYNELKEMLEIFG